MDINGYKSIIKVLAAYVLLYFCFLYLQSGIKFYVYFQAKSAPKDKGEKVSYASIKYNSKDRLSLMVDRTVGNTMEQAIPFLLALGLNTVFISADNAAWYGWIYIATRSYYPFAFRLGLPYLLFSTIPGYGCIAALLWEVVSKAI